MAATPCRWSWRRAWVGAVTTLATVVVSGGAGASSAWAQPATPIPAPFQSTYDTLQGQLTKLASLAPGTRSSQETTVLSSGLESANGNAMHPGVLSGPDLADSTLIVQRMKAMGLTGVTIEVSFPLLVSNFPDSGEYTTFYRDIAGVVHREHMTLTVEQNPLFENISSIPVASYYAGLTFQSYAAADHQMAQTIIDVMHPRYLSILTEPDTYTALLHQPGIDLSVAANGVQFVNTVMRGLAQHGTLVGGGTGSWTDASYDRALLAGTPIDFLDLHVYPIGPEDLHNMQAQVAEAKAARRPMIMSECWLYTLTTGDSPDFGVTAAPDEQAVMTYSFWEPLDQQFLASMVRYTRAHGFLVVSPTSVLNLFAYQPYTAALGAESSQQVRSSFYQTVTAALAAQTLSPLGRAYERLAR
ncbi:MAG: hypothetical protein ACLPVF_14640 [Acidimicrobiales bacterium]